MRTIQIRLVVAFAGIFVGATALADSMNLNDTYNGGAPFLADNFMFSDVIETNENGAGTSVMNHFQNPTMTGDMFIFDPQDLRVDVTPGPGTSTLTSQLEMTILGRSGQAVPSILFSTLGDYRLIGAGSFVEAEVNFFWEVMQGASAGASGSGTRTFNDLGAPTAAGDWDLNFSVGLPADATEVLFRFDLTQTAQATDGTASVIGPQMVEGVTIAVPEPSCAGLLLLAVVGLMAWQRR